MYNGRDAYERYADAMAKQGTYVCSWDDLDEGDQAAWQAVADMFNKDINEALGLSK